MNMLSCSTSWKDSDKMEELIYNALSPLEYPVRYGWYDEGLNQTHVTYFIVLETLDDYEDDDEATVNYTVQVDSWSKEDDREIIKQIKKLMKANGFTMIDKNDFFETDTKIYHKAIRFNYYEEVE